LFAVFDAVLQRNAGRLRITMDYYSAEMMAIEQQRAIRAEIAELRKLPKSTTGWSRRALAAGLAALARWLDPHSAGQVAGPLAAPNR
jgi:hypothetical protein